MLIGYAALEDAVCACTLTASNTGESNYANPGSERHAKLPQEAPTRRLFVESHPELLSD